ncbi:hypothetical protein BDV26DRAFT_25658 [Aspergillus bertholletiae]|uniref:Secreted protein n=1 Tax=Aspergillus bertholletiae TaxID=1226010 RepID=A0A5N7AYL3_9EURO|nr:hypothetical protein BDV26DRAFT_25658 [Aspergillus bertholletiae]
MTHETPSLQPRCRFVFFCFFFFFDVWSCHSKLSDVSFISAGITQSVTSLSSKVSHRSRTLTGHWHWPAGHWQEAPQLQP